MSDEVITTITEMPLPYSKQVTLKNTAYDNGMNVLRLLFREGSRFTTIDLDPVSADALGGQLMTWAKAQSDTPDN